jgi:hypothetical protein
VVRSTDREGGGREAGAVWLRVALLDGSVSSSSLVRLGLVRFNSAMNVPRGHQLSDADVLLLGRIEGGEHTFRPGSGSSKGDQFAQLVEQLRSLRDRGMIRLPDSRIMREQAGPLLAAGPCDLTRRGRQALQQDRRGLDPRPRFDRK